MTLTDGVGTVGITDHAQNALGDIVFVDLPDVGADVAEGDSMGAVESVKAASDIYSPLTGVHMLYVHQALLLLP